MTEVGHDPHSPLEPEEHSSVEPVTGEIAPVTAGAPTAEAEGIGPARSAGFDIGQEVGGRFVVEQVLGSSEGGTSYLVSERSTGRKMVLKVLDISVTEETAYQGLRDQIKAGSQIRHKNLVQVYGLGREGSAIFVAMEYVEGQTLARRIARRRELGQNLGPHSVLNIVAHVCNALENVHQSTVHGTLTPLNVYVTTRGKVKVSNLIFGRIVAEALHAHGDGLFLSSPFMAPELRETPPALSKASDVYALALITCELLSAEPLESAGAGAIRDLALGVAGRYGEKFGALIARATEPDPARRLSSASEFREAFTDMVDEMTAVAGAEESEETDMGVASIDDAEDPAVTPMVEAAPPEPAPAPAPAPEPVDEDPFARAARILAQKTSPQTAQVPKDTGEARYLVSRAGLDYGPFTRDQIIDQLYKDEVDELTSVLDRITQERVFLGDMPIFKKAIEEYVPVREERRRREQEQREKVVETAKTAGKGVVVLGILAGVAIGAVFAVWWYFIRPEPTELPVDKIFVDLSAQYHMEPPPREFDKVAVDNDLLALIFAKDEPAAPRRAGVGRRRGGGAGGAGGAGGGGGDDDDVSYLDLAGSGGSDHVLSDAEINNTIRQNFGGIRQCILAEFKRNPSFKGVTVQFFIKPSGSTGGVQVAGGDGPVDECLKSRFRAMRFPQHGGLNKGVTYPLRLQ